MFSCERRQKHTLTEFPILITPGRAAPVTDMDMDMDIDYDIVVA